MYGSSFSGGSSVIFQHPEKPYDHSFKRWRHNKGRANTASFGDCKSSGDSDTDVVFTDVETGERYIIGYITHGVTEKIKLEKDRWYKVEGRGNLTVSPVNVRIE